ncbi:Cytochrome P450 monooxygenase, partial [Pseudocercospora fuligena]
ICAKLIVVKTIEAFYNLYLHPLRKYPGPLLARATGLWYIYHLCNGSLTQATSDAHTKYGKIIRVGPRDLDYTDPRAWSDIYGHLGASENAKDSRELIFESDEVDIVGAPRMKHSALRRLLAHGFSDKALRDQQPVIQLYVDQLIQKFRAHASEGKAVNVTDWYSFVLFDITGHLVYGESFDCCQSERNHPWVQMLKDYVVAAAFIFAVQRIGFATSSFWQMVPAKYRKSRPKHHELVHLKLLRRLETKPEYSDLSQNMINAYEAGQLSLEDLTVNARVLVIAGACMEKL